MLFVVFSGLPGTGKSTLAEAVGRMLSIPVFAKDWLESSLVRVGVQQAIIDDKPKPLGYVGYELLATLAERQLMLDQSVIIDSVASITSVREQWRKLADHYQAQWRVVECICSDATLHQARIVARQRHIPDWPELTWAEVERTRSNYTPWLESHLILDSVNHYDHNLQLTLDYLRG